MPIYASLLIITAFVLVVVAAFMGLQFLLVQPSLRKEARPNPQIASWAQSMGWTYQPEAPEFVRRWSGTPFRRSGPLTFGVNAVQVVDDLLCFQAGWAPYATADFVNRITTIDAMATALSGLPPNPTDMR